MEDKRQALNESLQHFFFVLTLSFCQILFQSFSAFQTPPSCLTGFSMTDTLAIHRAASTMWTTDCAQKSSNMLLQKKTNKQTKPYSLMHIRAHAWSIVTPRQRRQTTATESGCVSMRQASVWISGSIWTLHC